MSAIRKKSGPHDEHEPGTLGALLYDDPAQVPIQESEWAALVRAIAGGDELALHALYDRAHRPAFTLILRITQNRETAEELTLDVFHDVWRKASDYDVNNGTVLGWIMNQARSRAIDRIRFDQRKKRVRPEHTDHTAPITSSEPPAAEANVELKQRARRLQAALEALNPEERLAIETAYFSELSYAETAERLNQPLGTMKTRIRSGLDKLRRSLAGGTNT